MSIEKNRPVPRPNRQSRPPADVTAWCLRFERACRSRGIRVTGQRLAVFRALAEDLGHPTAEALFARIRPEMPALSLATIYRILDSLEKGRLIRRVSTPGGVARFDANIDPHRHLFCRICGRMADLPAATPRASDEIAGLPDDFDLEDVDVRLVGRCGACRDSRATRRGAAAPARGEGRDRK